MLTQRVVSNNCLRKFSKEFLIENMEVIVASYSDVIIPNAKLKKKPIHIKVFIHTVYNIFII